MKAFIFNNLVPEFLRRKIIFKKTGVHRMKDVTVSDRVVFDYALPPNNTLWQKRLSVRYGHEPLVVQFYEKYLKKDDVVFDIGSQMGYFPSVISSIHPTVKVHCFEGNWFSLKYFNENKKLNDKNDAWVSNCVFVAAAAGKIEGVKAITLNDYCSERKITPTIMQMDVDGEELNVMNGATDLLKNNTTEFLIEVHPADLKKRGVAVDDFLSQFHKSGLVLKYLPDFREANTNWVSDYSAVNKTEEFYIYAAPSHKLRF